MKSRLTVSLLAAVAVLLCVNIAFLAATPSQAQEPPTALHGTCVWFEVMPVAPEGISHMVYRVFEDGYIEVARLNPASVQMKWAPVGR